MRLRLSCFCVIAIVACALCSCVQPNVHTAPVPLTDLRVFVAAEQGDLKMLQDLVSQDARVVNAYPVFKEPHKPSRTDSFSPLHLACLHGRYEVARFLLAHGANVNGDGGNSWIPLHEACFTRLHDDPRIVDLLLKNGADVHGKAKIESVDGRSFDWQPIHVAAKSGNLAALRTLVSYGADPRTLDGEGKNAMNHAVEGGYPETVDYLRDTFRMSPSKNISKIAATTRMPCFPAPTLPAATQPAR